MYEYSGKRIGHSKCKHYHYSGCSAIRTGTAISGMLITSCSNCVMTCILLCVLMLYSSRHKEFIRMWCLYFLWLLLIISCICFSFLFFFLLNCICFSLFWILQCNSACSVLPFDSPICIFLFWWCDQLHCWGFWPFKIKANLNEAFTLLASYIFFFRKRAVCVTCSDDLRRIFASPSFQNNYWIFQISANIIAFTLFLEL